MIETITLCKCNSCESAIMSPEDGVIVHGNIYVSDPKNKGGLIGNNFPTVINSVVTKRFTKDDVTQTAYCTNCFLKACNIQISTPRRRTIL